MRLSTLPLKSLKNFENSSITDLEIEKGFEDAQKVSDGTFFKAKPF
jgi:hypothetical protein